MQRSLTIREVAKIAGVSTATVSRAVNHSGPVSRGAREAIDRAIRDSGFRPNNVGRQLKTARTRTIGVLVPSLKNPIFADAVAGLERVAGLAGYGVLLASSGYRAEKEVSVVETFLRSRVDGMVLTVADEGDSRALESLHATGLPFVLMFNPVKRRSVSTVSIDNRRAARQVVGALLELGHERVTMIAGKLSESDRSVERRRGYEDALRAGGMRHREIVEVGFEDPDLSSVFTERDGRDDRPTAYFCSTDMLAISAIRALVNLGKRIPGDVSVAGFDGIAIGEHLAPNLSTAVQPADQMGEWAARHLLSRIEDNEPVTNVILPHRIRPGESWGRPPATARGGRSPS